MCVLVRVCVRPTPSPLDPCLKPPPAAASTRASTSAAALEHSADNPNRSAHPFEHPSVRVPPRAPRRTSPLLSTPRVPPECPSMRVPLPPPPAPVASARTALDRRELHREETDLVALVRARELEPRPLQLPAVGTYAGVLTGVLSGTPRSTRGTHRGNIPRPRTGAAPRPLRSCRCPRRPEVSTACSAHPHPQRACALAGCSRRLLLLRGTRACSLARSSRRLLLLRGTRACSTP